MPHRALGTRLIRRLRPSGYPLQRCARPPATRARFGPARASSPTSSGRAWRARPQPGRRGRSRRARSTAHDENRKGARWPTPPEDERRSCNACNSWGARAGSGARETCSWKAPSPRTVRCHVGDEALRAEGRPGGGPVVRERETVGAIVRAELEVYRPRPARHQAVTLALHGDERRRMARSRRPRAAGSRRVSGFALQVRERRWPGMRVENASCCMRICSCVLEDGVRGKRAGGSARADRSAHRAGARTMVDGDGGGAPHSRLRLAPPRPPLRARGYGVHRDIPPSPAQVPTFIGSANHPAQLEAGRQRA